MNAPRRFPVAPPIAAIGWLALLLLAAIGSSSATVGPPTLAFRAKITPKGPLTTEAVLTLGEENLSVIRWNTNPGAGEIEPLLNQRFAGFTIRETQWRSHSASGHEPTSFDEFVFGRAQVRFENHSVEALRTFVEDSSALSRWSLIAYHAVTLVPRQSCAIDAEPGSRGMQDPQTKHWMNVSPLVVDCDVRSLQAPSASRAYFEGEATLRLTYVQEAEERSLRVFTGSHVRPNASQPLVYDHTVRVLELQPRGSDPVLLSGDIHVRAYTPLVVAAGLLQIPPSSGSVEWGAWTRSSDIDALSPSGIFRITRGVERSNGYLEHIKGVARADGLASPVPATIEPSSMTPLALAAVAAAGLFLGRRRVLWFLGLFTRITQNKALDHGRRRAIMEAVLQRPGVCVQELCRSLQLSRRVGDYHVEVLCRQELLAKVYNHGLTALFPKGAVPAGVDIERRRASSSPIVCRLIQTLSRQPESSQRELARTLGVTQPYVSRLLRELVRLGLVRRPGGVASRYEVVPVP